MDSFTSSYKLTPHHDSSLWSAMARDNNITTHYRFYSDFQDNFEPQSFDQQNLDNPSLDLYDLPQNHPFFPYVPQEHSYYQTRQWFPTTSRVQSFPGIESEHHDEVISKREEVYASQGNHNHEAYKHQASKHPAPPANNTAVKGFMDLVTKASSFWMNKFGGPSTSAGQKHQEGEQQDSQKLFGKKDVKLTISYPCLITTNSLNNHRAAFETQEETVATSKGSVRDDKDNDDIDAMKIDKVAKKKIKKVKKVTNEKWGPMHDQKLSELVQELGTNWNEIAEAFKEDFVTAKYVRERYRVLGKKDGRPKRQAFTREEDLEIAKYYKQCDGNWESISKYFPTRRPAVIRNRFYSTIRGHLEEYLKEIEAQKSEEKAVEPETLQSNKEETSVYNMEEKRSIYNSEEKDQESQNDEDLEAAMEVEDNPSKSQEDILDSYFNKEVVVEPETLFSEPEVDHHQEKEQESGNSLTLTKKVEEDGVGELAWGDKPPKEAIEILNGRISLLRSLYNQTRMELGKLQGEA